MLVKGATGCHVPSKHPATQRNRFGVRLSMVTQYISLVMRMNQKKWRQVTPYTCMKGLMYTTLNANSVFLSPLEEHSLEYWEHYWAILSADNFCLFSLTKTILQVIFWRSQFNSFSEMCRFYPGGVLSSRFGRRGGRSVGQLPNLRNPYLCNRLMDFLHSKFCGIV